MEMIKKGQKVILIGRVTWVPKVPRWKEEETAIIEVEVAGQKLFVRVRDVMIPKEDEKE